MNSHKHRQTHRKASSLNSPFMLQFRPEYVRPGYEHNFNKQEWADDLRTEYDLESIMHYMGKEVLCEVESAMRATWIKEGSLPSSLLVNT